MTEEGDCEVTSLVSSTLPNDWDFNHLTQSELDAIARRLNTRAKKVLGFKTPESETKRALR